MSAGDSNSPVLDFTTLDFTSAREALLRYATSLSLTITDLNPSDPLVMLVSLLAYVTDLVAYTINRSVLEMVPTLAIRRQNFEKSAKRYGYRLGRRAGSTGTLRFTVNFNDTSPVGGPFNLPQTFRVSTEEGIIFQPNALTVVGPGVGTVTVDIDGSQGEWFYNEAVATASSAESQKYALAERGLDEDSLTVTVSAVAWTRVDVLALEGATQTFAVEYDDDDVAYLVFGDGINGAIPSGAIVATYRVLRDGEDGNVAAGTVTSLVDSLPGVEAVTNPDAFSWTDAETLKDAQAALPGFIRANNRAISDSDYEAIVQSVDGILKAKAIAAGGGGCGCALRIYAIPSSGGALSAGNITDITAALSDLRQTLRRIRVVDASYVNIELELDVRVLSTAFRNVVAAAVQNEVVDTYDVGSRNFGDFMSVQDLYDLLTPTKIQGLGQVFVRKFSLTPAKGVYPTMPAVGDGVVEHIVPETSPKRREWNVRMMVGGTTSPLVAGTFEVRERFVCVVSTVTDLAVQDDLALFPEDNGLVSANPWYVRFNPYSPGSTQRQVIGNTQVSVTVASGDLRMETAQGEEFVVERTHTNTGKVLREALGSNAAGGATVIDVVSGSWAVGDEILISEGDVTHRAQITGGSSGAWDISPAIPASGFTTSAFVDAVWVADDGAVEFVVRQGSTLWVTGDQFYVDVWPDLADIQVRPTDFPKLQSSGLTIRVTGGRA